MEVVLMPEMNLGQENEHWQSGVRSQHLDLGPVSPDARGSSRGKGDCNWIDLRIYVQELAVGIATSSRV